MTDQIVTVGGVSFEILEELGDYGYDWHIGALLRDADGKLFFAETSGCSCNDFEENLEPDDIQPVSNWEAAVEMSKEFFDDGQVATFAEKLLAADRSSPGVVT